WSRVWDVPFDAMRARFAAPAMMTTPGIPTTRWFDAVTLPREQIQQANPVKGMVVFGHGGNTVTRMPESVKGLEALELRVVAAPHPTTYSQSPGRRNGTYLLRICTSFETEGSRTASNRSLQWGEKIVDPIFESKDDYEAMYRIAGAV